MHLGVSFEKYGLPVLPLGLPLRNWHRLGRTARPCIEHLGTMRVRLAVVGVNSDAVGAVKRPAGA